MKTSRKQVREEEGEWRRQRSRVLYTDPDPCPRSARTRKRAGKPLTSLAGTPLGAGTGPAARGCEGRQRAAGIERGLSGLSGGTHLLDLALYAPLHAPQGSRGAISGLSRGLSGPLAAHLLDLADRLHPVHHLRIRESDEGSERRRAPRQLPQASDGYRGIPCKHVLNRRILRRSRLGIGRISGAAYGVRIHLLGNPRGYAWIKQWTHPDKTVDA